MIPYVLTFAEGILTFISPCILPMLPVYFLYLAGTPDDCGTARSQSKNRLLVNSLGFVAGFTLVFISFGAAASALGALFRNNRALLKIVSGTVMILFGLNFAGVLRLPIINSEKRFHVKTGNMRFIGSILFGVIFAFGWSPCLGTFLGSALALAGNSDTVAEGILMLLVFSMGLALPFIISAAIFENVRGLFAWFGRHGRIISVISGVLLITAGAVFVRNGILLIWGGP